jgi:hypothetical protein
MRELDVTELNNAPSQRFLLWLVPVFATIHNAEEALLMPRFLEARNGAIPSTLRGLLPPITERQFLISLLIVTAIPFTVAAIFDLKRKRGPGVYLLLGYQGVMLLNVLAHAMMSILIGGYAPGVATAIALNLPFSIYLLRTAINEQWVSRRALVLLGVAAVIIHTFGLPAVIILSSGL